MRDENFEWDDAKALENEAKHRVSFDDATLVFADAFRVEYADDRFDYGEDRYVVFGYARDKVLAVSYTIRDGRVRLNSARPATPQEKRRYHG